VAALLLKKKEFAKHFNNMNQDGQDMLVEQKHRPGILKNSSQPSEDHHL